MKARDNLARQSRSQDSEYLAQRRKGRKEIKLPDLASWREQISVLKLRATGKFAQAAKTLQHSNAKASLQAAIATVALAVVTAACGAPSASRDVSGTREIVTARGQLDDYMAQCTKRYGYDPEAASKLGSNVLGPGEREWRGCVYQGIEKYLIPRTLSPDVYRRAIAEDRKMTEAVANGQMTRAQRQARVQQLLEEIDRIEEANRAKLQMDRLEMEVRQDMRQRSLSPLLR